MTIDLTKRTEIATNSLVSLMKDAAQQGLNVDDLTAECVLVMDHSYSMDHLYASGLVQETAERVLAASLTGLDDDGVVPIHFFDSRVHRPTKVTAADYQGAVDRWRRGKSMGGTEYLPAIKQVLNETNGRFGGLFSKAKSGPAKQPTLVFFITDGAPNDDQAAIKRALFDAADKPVFWQFLGIGGYSPAFLEDLDTMPGRVVDNVGLADPRKAAGSEEAWFTEMLREFVTKYVPAARAAGIIA